MIKSIVFDLGGVYLNRGMWDAQRVLSEKYGIPPDKIRDILIKTYYKPFFSGQIDSKEYWKKCMKDLGFKESVKNLNDLIINSFRINEGMDKLIGQLRANGYRVGLLSDQTKEWWPRLDKNLKIKDSFDFCIISAEIGMTKPDIELYKLMLKQAGCLSEECIFVDDLEINLENAAKLGINTIFYTNTIKLKDDLTVMGVNINPK